MLYVMLLSYLLSLNSFLKIKRSILKEFHSFFL